MSYRFAVCTVQNSWWWTEELSETCRVLFQKQIWEISAYSWFYYKNVKVCVLWVWLKYVNFKLKIEELYGGIQILSVRQSKRWYRTWNQATTDSFHILSIQIFTIHSINWLRSLPVINSNSKWSLNKQTNRQLYPIARGIFQEPKSARITRDSGWSDRIFKATFYHKFCR